MSAIRVDVADAHCDDPIPANEPAWATLPGQVQPVTLPLRLDPEELAAVQVFAKDLGVPASTLARGCIVRQLAAERRAPTDAAAVVERL